MSPRSYRTARPSRSTGKVPRGAEMFQSIRSEIFKISETSWTLSNCVIYRLDCENVVAGGRCVGGHRGRDKPSPCWRWLRPNQSGLEGRAALLRTRTGCHFIAMDSSEGKKVSLRNCVSTNVAESLSKFTRLVETFQELFCFASHRAALLRTRTGCYFIGDASSEGKKSVRETDLRTPQYDRLGWQKSRRLSKLFRNCSASLCIVRHNPSMTEAKLKIAG